MNPAVFDRDTLNNLSKSRVRLTNISKETVLADQAEIANTFWKRLVGLLGRRCLNQGEGLILAPSNCIHSFFMRFNIDALFIDKTGEVIGILPSFKPFRLSPTYFKADLTVELPEHTLGLTQTKAGDRISIDVFKHD